MLLSRRSLTTSALVVSVVSLAAAGCGGGNDASAGSAGSGGSGGSAGAPAGPSAIAFSDQDALQLVPGQSHSLTVVATPPGAYTVRFSLLGDYKDASVDRSEVDTDSSGRAEVLLTAPSSATTFSVRAAIGETVAAKLAVSVSASGFATLQVAPSYQGDRSVSYWVASVRTGAKCSELSGDLTSDGDLKGTAPNGQVPQVSSVPVGPALAVTLRGGYSIAGCLDVAKVNAGEINALEIQVNDLPMQLADTDLELSLGLDPPKGDIGAVLGQAAVLSAFGAGTNSDAQALLDSMQAATPDTGASTAFGMSRKAEGWDATVASLLGDPKAIHKALAPWLTEAASSFTGTKTLEGRLHAAGKSAGHADFELEKVAGVDASLAGLAPTTLASWSAEPDDTVLLGTTFFFIPSRVLAALATPPAIAAEPGASNVPEALSLAVDCASVATALTQNGDVYPGCDAACTEKLCTAGLASLWETAANASLETGAMALLSVAATGAASVDDNAAPLGFSGTWLGALAVGIDSLPLSGPATAAKPPPPK
jgi:hypothetical protein